MFAESPNVHPLKEIIGVSSEAMIYTTMKINLNKYVRFADSDQGVHLPETPTELGSISYPANVPLRPLMPLIISDCFVAEFTFGTLIT